MLSQPRCPVLSIQGAGPAAVFVPLSGWLSERLGSRRLMLAAIALFSGASVLCAVSGGLAELIIFRALQGLGGAMMVPVGQLSVFRTTGQADMFRAVAYLTWPALVAPVVAPLLGGVLATYASWRWIFLINVPIGSMLLVAGWWLLGRAGGSRPPGLDVAGFGWLGIGLGRCWTCACSASARCGSRSSAAACSGWWSAVPWSRTRCRIDRAARPHC